MSTIRDLHNVWRDNLVPASFRGVVFHVEASSRAGGRRTVVHEYPKRNDPYAEDMGRHAIRWNFTGYLILRDKGIGADLITQMRRLNTALDADDAGMLIHPTLGSMLCMCERWSYGDQRQKGGYLEYDMQFVEAGVPAMGIVGTDSAQALQNSASNAENTATQSIKTNTSGVLSGGKSLGQGGIGSA
jgi:prophage DNA circulation protein